MNTLAVDLRAVARLIQGNGTSSQGHAAFLHEVADTLTHQEFLLREARPYVAKGESDPQHLTVSIDKAIGR